MEWAELILSFIEKQTGHLVTLIAAFAWPLVVVVFLVQQKAKIGALIDRVKKVSAGKEGVTVDIADQLGEVKESVAVAKEEVEKQKPTVEDVKPEAADKGVRRMIEEVDTEAAAQGQPKRYRFRDAAMPLPGTPMFSMKDYEDDQRNWLRMMEVYKNAPPVVIHHAWQEVRGMLYKVLGLEKTATDWWSLDGIPDEQLVGRAHRAGKLTGSLYKAVVELMMIHNDAMSTIGWQPNQVQVLEYVQNAGEVVTLLSMHLALGLPKVAD